MQKWRHGGVLCYCDRYRNIYSLCNTQIHTYNFAGVRADRRRALYSQKISERSADYENCSSKGAQILQRNTEKYF